MSTRVGNLAVSSCQLTGELRDNRAVFLSSNALGNFDHFVKVIVGIKETKLPIEKHSALNRPRQFLDPSCEGWGITGRHLPVRPLFQWQGHWTVQANFEYWYSLPRRSTLFSYASLFSKTCWTAQQHS